MYYIEFHRILKSCIIPAAHVTGEHAARKIKYKMIQYFASKLLKYYRLCIFKYIYTKYA